MENVIIEDYGKNNRVEFGKQVSIKGSLKIIFEGNNNYLKVGADVKINKTTTCVFHPGGIGAKGDNCSIKIGDGSIINGGNVWFECGEENTHISLGEKCLLAHNVKFSTTDNHCIYDVDTMERLNKPGNIKVGNHVWFCQDVLVLNHTEIADDVVVAARAVVNKKFGSNVCIGGVPAHVLRENINWDIKCVL